LAASLLAIAACAPQETEPRDSGKPETAHQPAETEPIRGTDRAERSSDPTAAPKGLETSRADEPHEVFPGVRANLQDRTVSFDGYVPLDAHDPETPIVYLELIACSPDTREHESLVATTARPSHIHAAMLLIGLEPGTPGRFVWNAATREYDSIEPTGDRVAVTLSHTTDSGEVATAPATDWVIDQRTGGTLEPLDGSDPRSAWVFSGSKIVDFDGREFYDADGSGTIIGLTTFSTETIAWIDVFSHRADIEEPRWIANAELVPSIGTPVVVTIRAIDRTVDGDG
jgi:hypothetical protein